MLRFLLLAVLLSISLLGAAQTPGLIYKAAGTGTSVLDPNGDGYTSATPLGFTTNDQAQSEIPYKPIPVPSVEPTADPGPGPDCGFTDFVDSGSEDPELTYYDGTNLLFRMRIGNTAPNSKGYSILIDTDQKFGFSGPNADPDAVVGNPGFEIEISLQTNFFVGLYSVAGTTSPTLKASFAYDNYAQKSIALTTNCGTPDYFYDFFLPFSAITTHFPSVTAATPLRMLAITTMNPGAAIGNNAQSDVGGIDDAAYGYNIDNIFGSVINNFYPTPISGINSGFPADRTSCPSITSSLNVTSTSISGTSSEANGTTIKVYKNGTLLNTATVTAGAWTLSGVSGLIAGDVITASATASGKTESVLNCTSITVAASCSADVTINATNTNTKNIGGTGVSSATIKVYQNGSLVTANPVSSATVDGTGTFCWKTNGNAGSCNGGSGSLGGGYKVTQTEPSKCESKGVYVCIDAVAQTTVPAITTATITTSTTSVSGTSVSGASIELYAGSTNIGSTVAGGTNWTITGLTFTTGQVITAKAISGTNCLSNASSGITVTAASGGITLAPVITGSYCTATTIASVSGTSVEATGTTIQLYNGVTLLGSTTTTATGTWAITGLSIAPSNTVSAKATATGKTQSVASNSVTILGVSSNSGLTVNGTITEGEATVTGTLSTAGTVNVYVDGSLLGSATVTGSTWSYTSSSPATEIYAGGTITATITIGTSCPSPASAGITVQCVAPSTSLAISPATATLCSGSMASVAITLSESGVIYQLYNGASTSGASKLGTGGAITLTSVALSASTTLTVKASKISPVACSSTLTASQAVTVTPVINTNNITSPATTAFCGSGDPAQITGSAPSGGTGVYSYQWQSSPDNTTFTNISGANSQDYNPPTITSTTYYRRVVNSGGCTSNSASITITIQVTDLTNTITAPSTTAFCVSGDPAAINGSSPTGGTGSYTYQWQTSADNIAFSDITLATSQNYDPPATSSTAYTRRLVSSGTCTGFPSTAIKIEVASTANTLITATPSSILANGTSTATIVVQLKDGAGNNLAQAACAQLLATTSGTLSAVTNNADGTYTATLTSSSTIGSATISGSLSGSAIADTETVDFVSSGIANVSTSTITASSASITANGTSTIVITVQLKDAGGVNITTGGATVALSETLGTLSAVTDNGDGTYTATLTSSTTAGTSTITGTIGGVAITDNETVDFTPGAASVTTSTITASAASIIANGTSTSTITVQLKDANGNNLTTGGATVALARTLGTLSSVTDNGNGTYTATLTSSTTAGTSTITGTISGVAITGNETVDFIPGTASVTTSTITASAASITANGTSTSTITVQLKDANGNNLTTGGATVALARTLGTLSSVTDNGDGTYTATLTSSTTAGTSTITGTIGGVAITDNETVDFIPGAASIAASTITAASGSILANGSATTTITVQLKDTNGNNLTASGGTVTLATSKGSIGSVTDNNNGTYTATLTASSTAETATITGKLNSTDITDTETVNFITGSASIATSSITAASGSLVANGAATTTITVQLKDASGNNLAASGGAVTLATSKGSIGSVIDNNDGTYTATLTSSVIVETATITGKLNGADITDTENVNFITGSASVATSTISAASGSLVANGTATTTITVQLKDGSGNNLAVSSGTVTLATSKGSIGSVTDNNNGTYTATLTASSTAETATITGKLNSTDITDTETVNFIAGPASVTTSTITASAASITANGTSTTTITVQLKDANGNNLTTGGATVVLARTLGTLSPVTDNGHGTYTATLTSSTTAGTSTITGTIGGVAITDNETVAFTPGAASVTTSTITASASSITANGTSTSTITVQLKDVNGNNLTTGGATVVLARTLGTLSSVTDNGNGTYTATLTSSTTAGTSTITGTIGGVAITDNETVAFTPGAASVTTSTITASASSITANGTSTSTITVQLKDVNGNNLTTGGATVVLARTLGTLSSVTDNGDGTYTVTLTASTTAGTSTITGTIGGVAITDNETVAFTPGAATVTTSTITASASSITANGTSISIITVQLKDVNGNNLTTGGATVVLARTLGTLSPVTDNGDGTYTATLTSSTTAGTSTITGTIGGVAITDNETVAFTPGAASVTTSTITAAAGSILANGTATTTINVQLKDANGNNLAVSGGTVSLATSKGSIGSITDNNDGTYTATITASSSVETATITGKLNGTDIIDTENVNFITGSASVATSIISAASGSIIADGTATTTITVQLKDASGNNLTISGGAVTLAASKGSIGTVTDNNDGTYAATLTASSTVETANVTGKLNGTNITDTESVNFIAGPASVTTSTITASASSITANGTSTSTITVQLKDANGNNLTTGGATVVLARTLGTLSTVTDNGDGTYTATLTSSGTAGTSTITGTIGGVAITDNETVDFTPGAASVTTSTITASASSITANGTSTSTITVQLKDASGNNLTTGGDNVLLSTTLGTLSAIIDNGNGTYTATLTSSGTPGTATITGSVNNAAITDTEGIIFTPRLPSGATSVITAALNTILADGTSATTITVQLRDMNNVPLTTGGATVTTTTTLGTLSTVTDNGDGTYTAVLTAAAQAGQATVSASVNSTAIADNTTVEFTAVPNTVLTSSITAENVSLPADGTSTTTITITVKDANGNAITGAGVLVNTTAGTLSAVTDNHDGTYTVVLTASNTPETATISFIVNQAAGIETINATFTPVTASTAFFIPEGFSPDGDGVNDTFVIEGADGIKITLKVYNRWGNLVYNADEYKNDWDGLATSGIVLGEKLPDGTYFYAIDLNNGSKPLVRYMTIKRK